MKILLKKTIYFYLKKYPVAAIQLLIWQNDFSKLKLSNFNALKDIYGHASIIKGNRVVFNIKGNDYRLIVSINFSQSACYIFWFGTHKEYDKIDAVNISFDTSILKEKKIQL